MHETLISVQETLYSIHETLISIQETMYSIYETLISEQETMYSIYETLISIHEVMTQAAYPSGNQFQLPFQDNYFIDYRIHQYLPVEQPSVRDVIVPA